MSFLQKQLGGAGGFGRDLRELRELRGFTLDDLAALTKIHTSVISALEEEKIEDLNDPLYAERHVRALVTVLDGRPGYFLKKYRDLLERRKAVTPEARKVRPTVRWRDLFVPSKLVAVSGFLLLLGLAAAYLIWQGRVLQEPPKLAVFSPVEGQPLDAPRVEVRGETDKGAKVIVNGRTAVVERDGKFFLTFDVPRGLTTITVEARRRYGSSATVTRRVTYERK